MVDKHEKTRKYLKPSFKNISSKELQEVLRCFSNIKNIIKKDYENTNVILLKNKCIPLRNTLKESYVKRKLRKDINQELHEKLNSLLLITGISQFEKDVPYSIEYFKFLMGEK